MAFILSCSNVFQLFTSDLIFNPINFSCLGRQIISLGFWFCKASIFRTINRFSSTVCIAKSDHPWAQAKIAYLKSLRKQQSWFSRVHDPKNLPPKNLLNTDLAGSENKGLFSSFCLLLWIETSSEMHSRHLKIYYPAPPTHVVILLVIWLLHTYLDRNVGEIWLR